MYAIFEQQTQTWVEVTYAVRIDNVWQIESIGRDAWNFLDYKVFSYHV